MLPKAACKMLMKLTTGRVGSVPEKTIGKHWWSDAKEQIHERCRWKSGKVSFSLFETIYKINFYVNYLKVY